MTKDQRTQLDDALKGIQDIAVRMEENRKQNSIIMHRVIKEIRDATNKLTEEISNDCN